MMKKSMIIFAATLLFSMGMIVFGWFSVDSRTGKAVLTEETVTGDRSAAEGLSVGFRADSGDSLHWLTAFSYDTDKTESIFKKGQMETEEEFSIYDEIRFTGWSAAPFTTRLKYDRLSGLQDKEVQNFYQEIQDRVMKSGTAETGKIRLADYLDYYPVSFRFQLGSKVYNSDSSLTGLKVYEGQNLLSDEKETAYDEDAELYTAFQNLFKIPVINNEYQEYTVSPKADYDPVTALGYTVEIEKPLGEGEDYYEFDPLLTIQQENILDGKKWVHPDFSEGQSSEAATGDETAGQHDSYAGKSASEYNLKNRILFIVNNRTAKGNSADMSQLEKGYGIYELPIKVTATATIIKGRRSRTVANPEPVIDQLDMVYSLDEEVEYVELSLSSDHRYLVVFSIKEETYYVEVIDADRWTSQGAMELFPASEKMSYAWGDDGCLAVTNHQGDVAVLSRTENENEPYEVLYIGAVGKDFDNAFFNQDMVQKEHSTAKYQYGMDTGLAVAVKDGKATLVQNMLIGDTDFGLRNAALECAVIDKSGILYHGRLKSSLVDLDYDMSEKEVQAVKTAFDWFMKKGEVTAEFGQMILPVRSENWCRWE